MIEVLYEGPEGWGDTAYEGDAGIDIPIIDECILSPGDFVDLRSGIKVAIPAGYYGRVAARSGALRKRRIRVYEGVIDAGYRGELFTYVENVGKVATAIKPGERLAQLIVQAVPMTSFRRIAALPSSSRGENGFGSSDANGINPEVFTSPGVLQPTKQIGPVPIYVGGPIDFRDHEHRDRLIERIDLRYPSGPPELIELLDPRLANVHESDPKIIWKNNWELIRDAKIGVFLFDDVKTKGYGFGSPIEIYEMHMMGKPVVIWHNSDNVGAYLRKLWSDGVIVCTQWHDFLRILDEEISKVAHA
jgi:dUTP pyrophosphatase